MATHSEFLTALVDALGADRVQVGDAVPARHHTDWSGTAPVPPLALVRPRSTEEVSALLRLCHAHRVPVVPQGGLTGLAGAAVPCVGGVALSLERMNAIEAVDARSATLTVQAGATVQTVQEAALAVGLQFGVVREQVLGLEVVLADGTMLPMLRPMLKNNTGYDLKQWFIGAEGTLGVVTRALLRLRPLPRAKATALVALSDYDAALALLGRLQGRFPGALSAFELMWRDFVEASLRWQGLREPFEVPHPFAALIDVGGQDEAGLRDALEEVLGEAMEAGEAVDAAIAQSEAQARALWKIREATAELPAHMHPPINFDVSLPQADIGRFAEECHAALSTRWPGHTTVFFGHIGDGNLHLSTDASTVGGEEGAVEELVYAQVAAFGGSVSAEHGIGLHKKPYLHASRTPAELSAMRAIKQALDPLHLMNPGKVFDL